MKKLFISLLAVASVIACTKSNVEFEETSEIGLKPVAYNMTKSMMTGTSFATSESFNVWAFYKQLPAGTTIEAWQKSAQQQTTYIADKEFVNNDADTWKGATSYYWPKVGSLLFAAYYPTNVADKADKVVYNFDGTQNEMSITGYKPDRVMASDDTNPDYSEDLMYANMTPASKSSNNVELTFKHALSWISVVLKKGADTPVDATITVSSVKFTDILPQGDAVVANQNDIVWTPRGTAAAVNVVESTETLDEENATQLAYEPLFIPQEMNDMVITYNIASADGANFTETRTVKLSDLKNDDADKWEPGKHYTYTITIGTSEILIAPTVTKWEDVEYSYDIQ